MVQITGSQNTHLVDISFMYSLKCNLSCPFCMYSCGPKLTDTLDLDILEKFIKTIDVNEIDTFGLYGGEPTLFLKEYSKIIELLPNRPKFMITNGSWSNDKNTTKDVLDFIHKYNIVLFISTNHSQAIKQNRICIYNVGKDPLVEIKDPDNFIPMGRGDKYSPGTCSHKCQQWKKPLRIAIRPDCDVYFQ